MKFDVTIPIKPHLKKYLLYKFHSSTNEICLTTKNKLGLSLINMFFERKDIYRKDFSLAFTDTITVSFSGEFGNRFGFFISKQNIYYFNKALSDDFNDRLFDFLDTMTDEDDRFQINRGIERFCERFSITEEEIAHETLRKAYQRERKRRIEPYNVLNINE